MVIGNIFIVPREKSLIREVVESAEISLPPGNFGGRLFASQIELKLNIIIFLVFIFPLLDTKWKYAVLYQIRSIFLYETLYQNPLVWKSKAFLQNNVKLPTLSMFAYCKNLIFYKWSIFSKCFEKEMFNGRTIHDFCSVYVKRQRVSHQGRISDTFW